MLHFLGLQPTSEHEYKFCHACRMAFIQCSLTGTALSWYIRLNDTYKQDWHAFIQAFKKEFSSQKNAYFAQVEALNLSKKDNETVRHFALKVQQLVENGWCNENASTINLKCKEILTKGLPKNFKDFANKRQVKHTSTVLEPSITFHTLVKLVDAEDIANDKIRTHDLALEMNNITKQLNTQTLEPSSQEQLNPKTQITRINLHKKNIVHFVIEQIIPSLLVSKNNEMMKTNEMYMLDLNLHKNLLYHTFVLLPMIEQNTMIINTEVEVPHETTLTTKTIHKIDAVLHLEIDLAMTKVLLLHNTLDHDMILTNVIPGLTALHTDPRLDLHIDTTLALDIDHAPTPEKKITKYTNSYRPLSRPRESRFSRSRSHSNSRNENNMIQPQDQSDPIKLEVQMNHSTAMANAVTPTSWFYTLYVHTPSSITQRDNPSRLETAFLLDSGASFSVSNYPTYITLTKLLDIRLNNTSDTGLHNTSKTLTVANQTEVPILHYANIILNTTIDDNSRYFSVPFAEADIKYNILGTRFFEDSIQNINIQDFTLEFKYTPKLCKIHNTSI